MGISSDDARQTQFSGTEHSYDAKEVEEFRSRVVEALAMHEAGWPDRPDATNELSAAQRARHQAVELAERMLRDVMGASGDTVGGLHTWQEAAMMRALAEEELAFAREEARRLRSVAAAERASLRAGHDAERRRLRADLQQELQASRAVAEGEIAEITAAARSEATDIVKRAVEKADETQRSTASEVQRLERRLGLLHSALADAESRFRRLAATAANEVGTMQAIIDQDVSVPPGVEAPSPTIATEPPPARPELYLASIDLTEKGFGTAAEGAPEQPEPESGFVTRDPDVGFYQRRLAGLRDRLEKSGHPPE